MCRAGDGGTGDSTCLKCIRTGYCLVMKHEADVWALVPAAGKGTRMGGDIPKQYLQLCGEPVLHWTLSRLCASEAVSGVVVGLDPQDSQWSTLSYQHPKFRGIFRGGCERQDTVLNGLSHLLESCIAGSGDWIAVHDAVRPCVAPEDIDRVIERALSVPGGAVLGSRLHDTLKRSDNQEQIIGTLERDNVWQAFTPQVFPLEKLKAALEVARDRGVPVTDESMAMELSGAHPVMVQGSITNIKITCQQDMYLASRLFEEKSPCV